MYIRKTA